MEPLRFRRSAILLIREKRYAAGLEIHCPGGALSQTGPLQFPASQYLQKLCHRNVTRSRPWWRRQTAPEKRKPRLGVLGSLLGKRGIGDRALHE
jgi:hypothetical protein